MRCARASRAKQRPWSPEGKGQGRPCQHGRPHRVPCAPTNGRPLFFAIAIIFVYIDCWCIECGLARGISLSRQSNRDVVAFTTQYPGYCLTISHKCACFQVHTVDRWPVHAPDALGFAALATRILFMNRRISARAACGVGRCVHLYSRPVSTALSPDRCRSGGTRCGF